MITLSNVKKQFGTKVLYDGISGAFNPTYRTGLIGPNGCGKTMLLRVLTGTETVDSGDVSIPNDLRIGYLPQEMEFPETVTPLDLVLEPFRHVLETHDAFEHLTDIDTTDHKAVRAAMRHMDLLQTQIQVHDAYSLEARAKNLLSGLGVAAEAWSAPITALSGGYRMRVYLAQLLLCEPDYLLLDEPTNHLDMDSLIWLERYLGKFRGGALVVSHDRAFLTRICGHTAELHGGRLTQYNGTVAEYLVWREERDALEARRAAALNAQINQAEVFIRRFKAKNTKATAARSKEKLIDRLKEQLPEQERKAGTIRFTFKSVGRSGSVPVKLDTVSLGYDGRTVLKDLSLLVNRGDKIAIIGPNGTGKSTLLKAIAGVLPPQSGTLTFGTNTEVRYYSQHRLDRLNPDRDLYQTIQEVSGTSNKTYIQSLLGAFLFSDDDVYKRVGVLSGGEKSRLCLAAILANPGNVLLLDEPTNHLDIASIEQLAETLAGFEGTALLVSHDEFFVSRIANRIIEMRPGIMRDFPGTLDDYRSYLEAGYLAPLLDIAPEKPSSTRAEAGAKIVPQESKEERIRRKEERKKLERRVEKLERAIVEHDEERAKLKKILDDSASAADYVLLQETQAKLDIMESEHDHLMADWAAAAEALEHFDE